LLGELEQERDDPDRRSSESGGCEGALSIAQQQNSSELWLPAPSAEYNNDLFTNLAMAGHDMAASSRDRWAVELPVLGHAGVGGEAEAGSGAGGGPEYPNAESLMQSLESTMFLHQDRAEVTPNKREEMGR